MTRAVEAKKLVKIYEKRSFKDKVAYRLFRREPANNLVEALKGVSFTVSRGEIFGFLGPNGAGKSTIVKILSTVLHPTAGEVYIEGFNVVDEKEQVLRRLAIMPEDPMRGFHHRLTIRDNLRFYAYIYGVQNPKKKLEEVVKLFDLEEHKNKWFQKLSRGEKQRVSLARAMIPDASVMILDEPLLGLDALMAKRVKEMIAEKFGDEERTIFLTTHNLAVADQLCDRIAVINEGEIIAQGTNTEVKEFVMKHSKPTYVVELRKPDEQVVEELRTIDGVKKLQTRGKLLEIAFSPGQNGSAKILEVLARKQREVISFKRSESTLEEVFIQLVERGKKDG